MGIIDFIIALGLRLIPDRLTEPTPEEAAQEAQEMIDILGPQDKDPPVNPFAWRLAG